MVDLKKNVSLPKAKVKISVNFEDAKTPGVNLSGLNLSEPSFSRRRTSETGSMNIPPIPALKSQNTKKEPGL